MVGLNFFYFKTHRIKFGVDRYIIDAYPISQFLTLISHTNIQTYRHTNILILLLYKDQNFGPSFNPYGALPVDHPSSILGNSLSPHPHIHGPCTYSNSLISRVRNTAFWQKLSFFEYWSFSKRFLRVKESRQRKSEASKSEREFQGLSEYQIRFFIPIAVRAIHRDM